MSFGDELNYYIEQLNCSAKELAVRSGISPAVISRYRSGERVPQADSRQIRLLARAIALLADEKRPGSALTEESVFRNLQSSAAVRSNDSAKLVRNLNALIALLHINVNALARHTNYDASYISRIRTGKRSPSDQAEFARAVSRYVIRTFNSEAARIAISNLILCEAEDLENEAFSIRLLADWLCSGKIGTSGQLDRLLHLFGSYDLTSSSREDAPISLPPLDIHLPVNQSYYGIREYEEGEILFLRLASALGSGLDRIIYYSDMPADQARNPEFQARWEAAVMTFLREGAHIDVIFNLERSFEEALISVGSWIPMFLTGQVSAWYLKGARDTVFSHLIRVSGGVAMEGESISGSFPRGRYFLTTQTEDVDYCRQRAEAIMKKAQPLVDIYTSRRESAFRSYLRESSYAEGVHSAQLCAPPLFTISEPLLRQILDRNQVPAVLQARILDHTAFRRAAMEKMLQRCDLVVQCPVLPREAFPDAGMALSVASLFLDRELYYTHDEYLQHIEQTREYASRHLRFMFKTTSDLPYPHVNILIHDGKNTLVTRTRNPVTHFVFHNPKLCSALENMISPIIEP